MILKNVQLTIILPEALNDTPYLDVLDCVKDQPMVKQMIKQGRQCTSCGVTKRSDNETEVVINFE